jgi:hypothetical protein
MHVDDHLVRRDIAAHHAERLAQRAFDDGDAVRRFIALGNAAAARAVHADGVNFVAIGERVVLVGQVADRVDRRDVAVHRIDAFETRSAWGIPGLPLPEALRRCSTSL